MPEEVTVWKCKNCGEVTTTPTKDPPLECPLCKQKVDKTQFEYMDSGELFFKFS